MGDWKWKHIDPITNQEFLGDTTDIEKDYDGVVIGLIHNNWALGALQLGLAYQISKDTAYFQKAKQILLGYATLYPKLPERTRSNGRLAAEGFGKIQVQDLNESQWLVNIVEAADLIWDNLSKQEQTIISTQLLLPAVEVINHRVADITNIQCWRNAAIGSVGFLLNNKELITLAMEEPTGFSAQIREGFNSEGITKDLSPGYQFFALHPLAILAQAALNHEYKVNIAPMQSMFSTPIAMSNSKLMLPPFNDSRPIALQEEAYLYEWASSKFHNPSFDEVLMNPKRDFLFVERGYQYTGWNLLFGYPYFKGKTFHSIESKNFDSSGVALLSKGKGDENLSCYIKYTNQIRNLRHFHNAQLDMAIIKGDEYVSIIPGNVNYSSPLSDGWYRSSLAHNTLLYNENQQNRSSAKCIGFGKTNGIDYVITGSANLYYHKVGFVRTLAILNENTVLVIDQFRGTKNEPALFDVSYHQAGIWENHLSGETFTPPTSLGYSYIMNATINRNQNEFTLRTKLKSGRIVSTIGVASIPFDVVTGYGEPFMNSKVPVTLLRIKTKNIEAVTVAYCISLDGKTKKISLEPNTNINIKSFLARLQLEDENGIKTKITVNSDKQIITENGVTNNKLFDVLVNEK